MDVTPGAAEYQLSGDTSMRCHWLPKRRRTARPTQDTIVSAFPLISGGWLHSSQTVAVPRGTRRAFSGHGAATEEARGPLDFTSHGGYRDRIAVRGRQSGQPRCRPPERASDPKGESPERSGLSNQNPFSQGRAAGDLVPAEPKQIVGFYLTPPDKGASVTTPALTFDNAFTLITARAAGSRAGHAHP